MDNQEIKTDLIKIWRELLIILLFVIVLFVWWRLQVKTNDLQTELNNRKTEQTTVGINEGTKPVDDRESNVYPKIDGQITTINNNIKKLSDSVKKLEKQKVTKEQSYEIFKDKNASQISDYFNVNGYPSTTTIGDGK